ncbi:MAG: hypothetical protein K0S75_1451 [Clostridia bacterium]|nr:hypothetical protein [Clostridia bacterium]
MEEIKFVYAVYMLYLFLTVASVAALFIGITILFKSVAIKKTSISLEKMLATIILIIVPGYGIIKITPLIRDVASYMKLLAK